MNTPAPSQQRRLLIVLAVSVISAVVFGFVLTAVFGPVDRGLRCQRSSAGGSCEILQTRFFGLSGNSTFVIPESAIQSARTECGRKGVGRASSSCNVDLILASAAGPASGYPVLSYALPAQADFATRKLNQYFANKSATSIAFSEDVVTPVLIYGLLPCLLLALVFGIRWRRSIRN